MHAAWYPQLTGHSAKGHFLVMPVPECLSLHHAKFLHKKFSAEEISRVNIAGNVDAELYTKGFEGLGMDPVPYSNDLPLGLFFDNMLEARLTQLYHAVNLPEVCNVLDGKLDACHASNHGLIPAAYAGS